MKPTIALLYGGAGREHDVSVAGYAYMNELLDREKYDVLPVYIERDGRWHVRMRGCDALTYPTADLGGSLYTVYGSVKIDAAIPLLHGDSGEDGSIQGALECSGIKYIGADTAASAICIDKVHTKAVAASLGIPTVPHVAFSYPTDIDDAMNICLERLGLPLFVKPRRLGSSIGAYPIYTEDDFKKLFPLSMKDGKNLVMVEKLLTQKRELECAFCQIDGQSLITEPAEVLINGFYGYREKYFGDTRTVTSPILDESIKTLATSYAKALAREIGLRHLGRIDFFLNEGNLYFNEVNTFPGFTKDSLYPKMLEHHGIAVKHALNSFIKDVLC